MTRIPGGRDAFPVRLNPGQRERLDALAAKQRRSAADVLRHVLDIGLDAEEASQAAADKPAPRKGKT